MGVETKEFQLRSKRGKVSLGRGTSRSQDMNFLCTGQPRGSTETSINKMGGAARSRQLATILARSSRDPEREAQSVSVRGPARFPTVALTVVVMAEGAVGGGWQPSPQDPPGPLAWGPVGELGVPGQAEGRVLSSSRAPGPAALGTSSPF